MKTRCFNGEKFFMVDSIYIGSYAKLCGWRATLVYNALCYHVNKHQKSWPSVKLMTKELKVSKCTILRGIKDLLKWNIISIEESKGRHNTYILTHKTGWKDYINQSPTETSLLQRPVSYRDKGSLPQRLHQSPTETPTISMNYTNELYRELTDKQRGENLEKMALLRKRVGGFSKHLQTP